MRLHPTLAAIMLFLPRIASAQFFLGGDDPASTRWSSIESPHFKVIYPSQIDSTARSYILELEKYRKPVSWSAGFVPGEMSMGKMPVVLHPFNAVANGSVAWAPKRMDLYSSPQGYTPEPMPWTTMLGIHESRHVAQMQFGLSHCFRPFRYVFGEMFAGAMAGIYPDKWLLEGDAVVAETALSNSGRGRVADFMNYYRIAFDNGDFRDADRWAYGSYWHYTPDHYAFGYMTLSGIRYLYDVPDFTGQLLTHYARRPYDIVARNTVSKKLTGRKFRTLVDESMALYHRIWTEDADSRGPFLPYGQVSGKACTYTEYAENLVIGDDLYSLKESFNKGRQLVKMDEDGEEEVVCAFSDEIGLLHWSPALGKLFWSETVPHPRWSLKYGSAIRYMNLETGRKGTLTKEGRLFNPNPSPSNGHIAATEYTDDGRSHLVILNGKTGEKEISFSLPDSLQLVETAWHNDTIFGTAISAGGYGIYMLETRHLNSHDRESEVHHHKDCPYTHDDIAYSWKEFLAPSPVVFFNFGTDGMNLSFTSDRTGVNEIYTMDPHSGKIYQETSTRYGCFDFTYSPDGEYMICSASDRTGAPVVRIKADSLLHKEVDFGERYIYVVADSLSRQEKRLAEACCAEDMQTDTVTVSGPERFRKVPHLLNLHSWAPVYFNYDNISSGSYEDYYSYASPGAVVFLQNKLGTFTGFAGYSAHGDPVTGGKWRHSGHVKLTYSGLYPVIEATFDINDRASRTLSGTRIVDVVAGPLGETYGYTYGSSPLVSGSLSMYIPFNFSSGGWSRGLVPQVSYEISNDRFFMGSHTQYITVAPGPGAGEIRTVSTETEGEYSIYQALSASVRYYTMRPAAHADVYPELGIGVEAGAWFHPGLKSMVSPSAYIHAYGYVPGIYGNQGLMLSATFNKRLGNAAPLTSGINTLPRGLSSAEDLSSWAAGQSYGVKLTASYAMPFPMGDFHIGNLFYVTRGIITPHFDYSFLGRRQLFSAGATLEIEFGNFIGLQFPASLGVTYSYNGGPSFQSLKDSCPGIGSHFVGPVFSIDF